MPHHHAAAVEIIHSTIGKPSRLTAETALLFVIRSMEFGRLASTLSAAERNELATLATPELLTGPSSGWAVRVEGNKQMIVDLVDPTLRSADDIERLSALIRTCARLLMSLTGNGSDHLGNQVHLAAVPHTASIAELAA